MAPIRVSVLYFAGLRDAVGVADEALDLPDGVRTVGDLCDHLAARHNAYAERRASVRVARNEAFAEASEAIGDGDVIALIPPVAGG
jgi:molybdopterin synthase sulfur carrier subunit